MMYIYLLVRVAYLERDDANQNAHDEEYECDDEPDDTPHFICKLVKGVLAFSTYSPK